MVLATSMAVKHVFLQGCQLLSFTRNQVSALSICACLCLGLGAKMTSSSLKMFWWLWKDTRRGRGNHWTMRLWNSMHVSWNLVVLLLSALQNNCRYAWYHEFHMILCKLRFRCGIQGYSYGLTNPDPRYTHVNYCHGLPHHLTKATFCQACHHHGGVLIWLKPYSTAIITYCTCKTCSMWIRSLQAHACEGSPWSSIFWSRCCWLSSALGRIPQQT